MIKIFLSIMLSVLIPTSSYSYVKVDGYFMAKKECPTYTSIKKETNPNSIMLKVDRAYIVNAKNRENATHYQVTIKSDLSKELRWVSKECGILLTNCDIDYHISKNRETINKNPNNKEYVLAISWQNAFCQLHKTKKECKVQNSDSHSSKNFSLHGLWPQPRDNIFCNVSDKDKNLIEEKAWCELATLNLPKETFNELREVMPGVTSCLQRYEWTKHGTCYSESPVEYYSESISLIKQINSSPIQDFFENNIGKRVNTTDIKKKFNEAFGEGAGNKIKINCKNNLITEIQINLKGEIEANTNIRDLIKNAENKSTGCKSGFIDAVGF